MPPAICLCGSLTVVAACRGLRRGICSRRVWNCHGTLGVGVTVSYRAQGALRHGCDVLCGVFGANCVGFVERCVLQQALFEREKSGARVLLKTYSLVSHLLGNLCCCQAKAKSSTPL